MTFGINWKGFAQMNRVNEILVACGFGRNKRASDEELDYLTKQICIKYGINDFDFSAVMPFLREYNGLTVDAAEAVRKSMKAFHFHGGFQVSLEYISDEWENLVEEFAEIQLHTNSTLFPVGNAFGEILSVDSRPAVYAGYILTADSWEEFLEKLAADKFGWV